MMRETIEPIIKSIIEIETGKNWINIDINNITPGRGRFSEFFNIEYSYDNFPDDDMIYMGSKFLSKREIIEFTREIKLNQIGIV